MGTKCDSLYYYYKPGDLGIKEIRMKDRYSNEEKILLGLATIEIIYAASQWTQILLLTLGLVGFGLLLWFVLTWPYTAIPINLYFNK